MSADPITLALVGTAAFQGFTSIRQGQAQSAQFRAEAQAASIRRDFELKQNEIQRQKDINDIKNEQVQILRDTSKSLAYNIAKGASSGLLQESVLDTKILAQGLDQYLTGNVNLDLINQNYMLIGGMIDKQARDEMANKEAAAVNVQNLAMLEAGSYLAQGYLNYKKYSTKTTKVDT
tara:strand:+ start:43 stop:573 length:531 start_codon:yes stop_codon:yes gene_type:complete